jgi:ADP-heptose:LPS heptosyltransferase
MKSAHATTNDAAVAREAASSSRDAVSSSNVGLDPERVERVLVTCLDNLGDLVFTSSLVPPLAAHFPRARFTLWCKAYALDVARLVPGTHAVVASDPFWDRAPGRGKGRFGAFARTVKELRREQFDLAVITSAQWRACAAVRFTGARVRLAQRRHRNALWLTHVLPPADSALPVLVDHAHLLDALGVPHGALRYALDRAPLEIPRERMRHAIRADFVALHAFASQRDRCVALAEWITLARELARRGQRVVWIGSRSELEELRAGQVMDAPWQYSDRLTDGTLHETAALVSLATLFVGHDSGPMHVANALGVPVVGIFAPGQPQRTFPQGTARSRVVFAPTPREIGAAHMLSAVDELVAAGTRQ